MSDTLVPGPTPRQVAVATALTAVVFGAVDAVWLTLGSGDLYERTIGHLLADTVNPVAAGVFYVIYVLGLVHFVIRPGLSRASLGPSLRDAFFFGIVTYATFDLTSMAVMRDFPAVVAVVDIAWGAFICTLTAAVVLASVRRWSLGR